MINEIILAILGCTVVMVVDVFWWKLDYKKIEKGLEWHEHYHVGIELMILAVVINLFNSTAAAFFLGAGLMFIVAEWRQVIEIVGKKVKPGHPFAYGSTHFKTSTIVGISLMCVLLFFQFIFL